MKTYVSFCLYSITFTYNSSKAENNSQDSLVQQPRTCANAPLKPREKSAGRGVAFRDAKPRARKQLATYCVCSVRHVSCISFYCFQPVATAFASDRIGKNRIPVRAALSRDRDRYTVLDTFSVSQLRIIEKIRQVIFHILLLYGLWCSQSCVTRIIQFFCIIYIRYNCVFK